MQDRAIIGRVTNLVRIKDPCTGHLIAQIRDPKIAIDPYQNSKNIIDMQGSIVNCVVPVFSASQVPVEFNESRIGWHVMLDLIKKKRTKKQFWEFIERLRQVRLLYN